MSKKLTPVAETEALIRRIDPRLLPNPPKKVEGSGVKISPLPKGFSVKDYHEQRQLSAQKEQELRQKAKKNYQLQAETIISSSDDDSDEDKINDDEEEEEVDIKREKSTMFGKQKSDKDEHNEGENKNNEKDKVSSVDYNPNPKYVKERQNANSNYIRVVLPSKNIFYDFDDIQIKPFEVGDLLKLSRAQQERNYSMVIDTIDAVTNQNVRELSKNDFYYILYMLRLLSYPKTPTTFNWVSKYGNKNKTTIDITNLEVINIDMTKDEYKVWEAKGFSVPRVRDLEIELTEDLDQDLQWLFERAQFLTGDNLLDKIEKLKTSTLDVLEDMHEFRQLINHGVKETVTLVDKLFDPEQYLEMLKGKLRHAQSVNEWQGAKNNEIRSLNFVISNIEAKLKRKEEIEPDTETIRLSVDLLTFFPIL